MYASPTGPDALPLARSWVRGALIATDDEKIDSFESLAHLSHAQKGAYSYNPWGHNPLFTRHYVEK